jgi:hypothetical protein
MNAAKGGEAMDNVYAMVDEVRCTTSDCPNPDPDNALHFAEPLRLPCLINVVCPYCETILRCEILEEQVAELRHDAGR